MESRSVPGAIRRTEDCGQECLFAFSRARAVPSPTLASFAVLKCAVLSSNVVQVMAKLQALHSRSWLHNPLPLLQALHAITDAVTAACPVSARAILPLLQGSSHGLIFFPGFGPC